MTREIDQQVAFDRQLLQHVEDAADSVLSVLMFDAIDEQARASLRRVSNAMDVIIDSLDADLVRWRDRQIANDVAGRR